MKKIILLFVTLLSIFFIIWGIKLRNPINRPDNYKDEVQAAWYDSAYTAPVPDEGWILDPTIPDNYIPVPGEDGLFMEVDEHGHIVRYYQRIAIDEYRWKWEEVNPDIPENYISVEGIENLYKVIDAEGNERYLIYIRNSDDTYCFVDCDSDGIPYYDGADAGVISNNYIRVDDNIYAVYNDNGVKEGYAERVPDNDRGYVWKYVPSAEVDFTEPTRYVQGSNSNVSTVPTPTTFGLLTPVPTPAAAQGITLYPTLAPNGKATLPPTPTLSSNQPPVTGTTVQLPDGSYTVTEVSTNTVTENGYAVTYKTTVYNTYDKNGKLIATISDPPIEISRRQLLASETPNKSLIEESLDKEYARVSALVKFDTDKAKEVLAALNAERTSQGLSVLTMNTSGESYKLACIRAADMAVYNYSASESPMYGTINDLASRYNCKSENIAENIWRTTSKSAPDIHIRLQSYDASRNNRMSPSYTEVGIAIVTKDGQDYIAEIYLK